MQGLTSGATYYVIVVDASTIRLADSPSDALAGLGLDDDANRLLKRPYRAPWTHPAADAV